MVQSDKETIAENVQDCELLVAKSSSHELGYHLYHE